MHDRDAAEWDAEIEADFQRAVRATKEAGKRKRKEAFAMIPLLWATRAAKATRTPKAMVWVRLPYLAWRQRARTFPLPNKWLEDQGVSRHVKNRALCELEADGLIAVERRPRKSPRVTLL
jgi:hypothetical protein